ncbi:MAG: hypothetical protein OXD36_07120 [Rhodobacter sp.]|nr:hypothetical protein [Rhodobacter sp.]MCY4241496.1 hypothetical protein [Rhodobacter sp.]
MKRSIETVKLSVTFPPAAKRIMSANRWRWVVSAMEHVLPIPGSK